MPGREDFAEPFANHSNVIHAVNASTYATFKLDYQYLMPGSVLGLVGNLLVIYTTFFGKESFQDYKICLVNTALIDVVNCCIVIVKICFFDWLYNDGNGIGVLACSISVWLAYLPSFSMIYSLPITPMYRCCVILWNKPSWVTKMKLLAVSIATWIVPLSWPITDLITRNWVVPYGGECSYHLFTPGMPEMLMPFLIVAIVACVVTSAMLYWKMRGHISKVKAELNLTAEQVVAERRLQKCAAAQAFTPLFCLAGMTVAITLAVFIDGHTERLFTAEFLPNITIWRMLLIVYSFNAPLDMLAVFGLLVVYKKELKHLVRKTRCLVDRIGPTSTVHLTNAGSSNNGIVRVVRARNDPN